MDSTSPLVGHINESKTNMPSTVKNLIQRNVDGEIRLDSQKESLLKSRIAGRGIDLLG